jgi:hypothetical protein
MQTPVEVFILQLAQSTSVHYSLRESLVRGGLKVASFDELFLIMYMLNDRSY